MKTSAFDYHAPCGVAEAVALLAGLGDGAKVQPLGPGQLVSLRGSTCDAERRI